MGLRILAVSILAAYLAVPVASASLEESLTSHGDAHLKMLTGWNELLGTEGIFDESHATVQVKSGDATFVIQQLKDLLSQQEVMQGIYNRYRMQFKDKTDSFSNSRISTFKDKLLEIAAHNLEANSGKRSWWKGVNQFTDMTSAELQTMTSGGFKSYSSDNFTSTPSGNDPNLPASLSAVALPDSKSYLEENRVCPAKNQLTCNAGAIFATVSVCESVYAIKKKRSRVTEFSEQELVNCIKAFSCDKPVSVKDVLDHVKKRFLGMQADQLYSNPASKGACTATPRVFGLKEYKISLGNSEENLKTLLEKGPVIVELHASDNFKQTYAKGVYDGAECGDNPTNHAVALIGYGSEGGKDYWLIKNSWGQNWGVQGFLKLARNGGDVCGVLKTAYAVSA